MGRLFRLQESRRRNREGEWLYANDVFDGEAWRRLYVKYQERRAPDLLKECCRSDAVLNTTVLGMMCCCSTAVIALTDLNWEGYTGQRLREEGAWRLNSNWLALCPMGYACPTFLSLVLPCWCEHTCGETDKSLVRFAHSVGFTRYAPMINLEQYEWDDAPTKIDLRMRRRVIGDVCAYLATQRYRDKHASPGTS